MTSQDILDLIRSRAQDRWGDRWLPELVKRYCAIAHEYGDTTATPIRRRPQLARAFDRGSCTVDTLIIMLAAVDCAIRIIAQEDVTP